MWKSFLGLAMLVSAMTGCLSTTSTVKPSGEALEVRVTSGEHGAFVTESGRYYKPGTYSNFEGLYEQGKEDELDELDFYTIAGAQNRVDGIVAWREAYNRGVLIESGIGAASTVVAAAGLGLYAVKQSDPAKYDAGPLGLVAGALFLGGGAGVAFAIYAWSDQFFGPPAKLTDVDNHKLLYPLEEAFEAAGAYNARLEGRQPAAATP